MQAAERPKAVTAGNSAQEQEEGAPTQTERAILRKQLLEAGSGKRATETPGGIEEASQAPAAHAPVHTAVDMTLSSRLAAVEEELERTRKEFTAYRESVQRTLALILPEKPFVTAFEALRQGYTTVRDTQIVRDMCQRLNGAQWGAIFEYFYRTVLEYRAKRPEELQHRDAALPPDWYREPWYCFYPQFMGVRSEGPLAKVSSFRDLIDMLPYWEALGFRNLAILPHYDSAWADGGYDVRAYVPHPELGGMEAFQEFVTEATRRGFRLMTEAIFGHTGTDHEWFQRALRGEPHYLSYYLRRDGREKIAEFERDGEVFCRYRDPNGTITERVCLFPDIDRTHGLWVPIEAKAEDVGLNNNASRPIVQFYRTFLPFQADLDLQNPEVLREFFGLLGDELNQGTLGKRIDAVAHWIKRPGTPADGLPETHTLLALFKSFMHHICPRSVLMPEVVRPNHIACHYAGIGTELCGRARSSEGDLVLSFEIQAALREMLWFCRTAPFWRVVLQLPKLPPSADWCIPLAHHDDIYLGFFEPSVRKDAVAWIRKCGGMIYRGGLSGACQEYDLLARDPRRLGMAFFTLLLGTGTPFIYSGLEVGANNAYDYAHRQMERRYERLRACGCMVAEGACLDPRDLHRGPLTQTLFQRALEKSAITEEAASTSAASSLSLLRRLNELRATRPSLRTGCMQPVDTGRAEILAFIRHDATCDRPLLCIGNLSDHEIDLVTPAWQLGAYFEANTASDLICRDLLGDISTRSACGSDKAPLVPRQRLRLEGTGYVLSLRPLATLLLERVDFVECYEGGSLSAAS